MSQDLDAAFLGWVRQHYGEQIAGLERLPGYVDDNYRAVCADGVPQIIIKRSAPDASESELRAQIAVLDHLESVSKAASPAWPRGLRTRSGASLACYCAPEQEGQECGVRAQSVVPGRMLFERDGASPELLESVGHGLAELTEALEGFDDVACAQPSDWDLRQLELYGKFVEYITEAGLRRRVEAIFTHHVEVVAPLLARRPLQVIHGDLNTHNLFVADASTDSGQPRLSGIIDFGDMTRSHLACELAIALTYLMMPTRVAPHRPVIELACDVIRGFVGRGPIPPEDIALLPALIELRLAQSLCHSSRARELHPENAEYLGVSRGPAIALLESWGEYDPAWLERALRHAAGLEPCAQHTPLVTWLATAAETAAPVLGREFAAAARSESGALHVLDASIASDVWDGEAGEGVDPKARALRWSRAIDRQLEQAGADYGVGQYGEARWVYQGSGFVEPRARGTQPPAQPEALLGGMLASLAQFDERRTIHLGIDLFAPAGHPVHTPWAGRVIGLADNAGDLNYGPTVIVEHDYPAGQFYVLYGHLDPACLEQLEVGEQLAAGQAFASLAAPERNGGWPPHLHLQIMTDMLGGEHDFPGVATPRWAPLYLSVCVDPNLLLGIDPRHFPARPATTAELWGDRKALIGPAASLHYREPLQIVRARDMELIDACGRSYLDFINNVAQVGHDNPSVHAAMVGQMTRLNTNSRYLHPLRVAYARALTATMLPQLNTCHFVCSGSEAVELALRMAREHTGRRALWVMELGYHGHTSGALSASDYKFSGPGGAGVPEGVLVLPLPQYTGDPGGRAAQAAAERCLIEVDRRLQGLDAEGQAPAALMAEPIVGCGGHLEFPTGYLAALAERVRARGGLVISDEAQVGFGRLGDHWWGYAGEQIEPDIVTLGKGIGNGYPMGAVVCRAEIAQRFANGMEWFSTFGGNPVACAAGLAVLDWIGEHDAIAHAQAMSARLRKRLERLASAHSVIAELRGRGLFLGLRLRSRSQVEPASAVVARVLERMKELRVLLGVDGRDRDVIKIKPPLTVTGEQVDRCVACLGRALTEVL